MWEKFTIFAVQNYAKRVMEGRFNLDDTPSFRMLELDEVDSTSSFLRRLDLPEDHRTTVVTAEFQSSGRGCGTNRWESERGKNLLFSLRLWPRRLPVGHAFALSEATALAVREALDDALSADALSPSEHFTVKWPNDIYFADSKVAGIIIENDLQGDRVKCTTIGIGINLNQRRFLSDAPNPLSLSSIVGHDVDRRTVLELFMNNIMHHKQLLDDDPDTAAESLHERYKRHLYRRLGKYKFRDGIGDFCASIVDVEPSGRLILRDENGQLRSYAFKEVGFVL